MTYEPPGRYRRTAAERDDQLLSWRRSDRAFFAAGACHILAFEAIDILTDPDYAVVGLQRASADYFDHVYVSDGTWAFDYHGWTQERELIATTVTFETNIGRARVSINGDLAQLCSEYRHRNPENFAFDPRPRARQYAQRLLKADGV